MKCVNRRDGKTIKILAATCRNCDTIFEKECKSNRFQGGKCPNCKTSHSQQDFN